MTCIFYPCNSSFATVADELEYYKSYACKVEGNLAEVQLELEEFQMSSRELEDELEKEVESTERRYNEIRIRNEALRQENDEWKVQSVHHNCTVF